MNVGTKVLVRRSLDLRQGSDNTWSFGYREELDGVTVVNTFAGWTARCQIRGRVGGEVWATVVPTLTAAGNRLEVTMHLPASATEASAWNDRAKGVYDVELVRANGSVIPLAEGPVLVAHDVTRL